MAILLTYIEPFRKVINTQVPRNGLVFGDEKGPWSIDIVTNVLANLTEKELGFRMTVQIYRQISVAIDRKFMRMEDLDLEFERTVANDLLSGHSTAMANSRYGRLMDLIHELTAESIDEFRRIIDLWMKWLGLVARLPESEVCIQ